MLESLELGRGAQLLELVDRVVKSQAPPPALRGRIALVVRGRDDDAIWCVELSGHGASCAFLPALPDRLDTLLVLDDEAAASIIDTGALGRGTVERAGDGRLLEGFIRHYLIKRSWLDVRAGRIP